MDAEGIGLESATTARGADRLPREVRDTHAILNLMELATQIVKVGRDPDRTILLRWDALPQLGLLLLSQLLIGAMDGEVQLLCIANEELLPLRRDDPTPAGDGIIIDRERRVGNY